MCYQTELIMCKLDYLMLYYSRQVPLFSSFPFTPLPPIPSHLSA